MNKEVESIRVCLESICEGGFDNEALRRIGDYVNSWIEDRIEKQTVTKDDLDFDRLDMMTEKTDE